MSTPAINSYKLDRQEFPVTLYRVDYPGCKTTYSQEEGFQAQGNFTPYYDYNLRSAVEYHLNWNCKVPSPFISTFENRQHARNWARDWREKHHNQLCHILEIRLEANHGVAVFRVADLVDELGISTDSPDEYLCLHWIPSEAVVWKEAAPRA
ncbi:hypothetical protein FRC19_004003 [Serendipita sp. 401]|nr:hypothetical protein FRC19_004003 [Serendipita sp. 401]KAG9038868.1 hypothetical protein FS842_003238 [Serendipita sp. 407]